MASDDDPPRVLFSKGLEGILTSVSEGEFKNTSLSTPSSSHGILDDINKRIAQNRSEQDEFSKPLDAFDDSTLLNMLHITTNKNPGKKTNAVAPDVENDGGSAVTDAEVQTSRPWYMFWLCRRNAVFQDDLADTNMKYDDGLSKLSAEDYVKIRLLPFLGETAAHTPFLSVSTYMVGILVSILSVTSSALSTFGLSVFIPALLAFSGAVTFWGNYQQTEQRLYKKNVSIQLIRQMLVWWDGLTMIEKRVPSNKDTLIRTTEMSILSQATALGNTGGMNNGGGDGDSKQGGSRSEDKGPE